MPSVLGLVDDSGTLEDVLQHHVTSECLSISNANGTFQKSQKSKLLQTLAMNVIPEPEVYTSIIDMGLIWRLSTPSMEDRGRAWERSIPGVTNAKKMMNLVLRRHGNAGRIICVNDSYDQNYINSIKDRERILRQKQLPIRNVFMKAEDKFPSTRDFHPLLSKSENKIHLQAFLQNEFQRTATTTDTEIIYCVVGS